MLGEKILASETTSVLALGLSPVLGTQCRKALRIGSPIQVDLETLEMIII